MSSTAGKWNRILVIGVAVFGLLRLSPSSSFGDQQSNWATAEQLVEEARRAQLDGDSARYYALLRRAIRLAPDYELPRWQLGQVRVDDEWLAVEEAQRRAGANPKQDEYRQLKAQYGQTPQGQLALARWCRKNDLHAEARFHWMSVLAVDPNNEEALRAVGMRWHHGRLLSPDQIAEQKEQWRELKRTARQWKPHVSRWQRDIAGNDAAQREAALQEIRSLTDSDVIPALEALTLGRGAEGESETAEYRQTCLAFLESLGRMDEHAATESLVRHAVLAPAAEVRAAAIEKLKSRPQHDYVPLLLSGLAMPIESSFQVRTDPDGSVHYTHSLYREGPEQDWSMDTRLSAMQYDLGGRTMVWNMAKKQMYVGAHTGATPAALRQKAAVATDYQRRYGTAAAQTELQVRQANQAAEWLNARIIPALAGATGQELGENPTKWWDWWRAQNEYYAPEKDVARQYVAQTDRYYYGFPAAENWYPPLPPLPPPRTTSCFAKGTLVWTKTGQKPIETLELGDLVLSQNVETGELAYRPISGRTVRPPSRLVKLSFGGESLRTTLGHPLWVAGIGWRMAKEIDEGAILHGVAGSPRVEAIEKDGEEEAYNLIVSEFNTYFVGESGILVHDNTPRRPTTAAAPSWAK